MRKDSFVSIIMSIIMLLAIPSIGSILSEGERLASYNKILAESEVVQKAPMEFIDGEPYEIDNEVLEVYKLGDIESAKIHSKYMAIFSLSIAICIFLVAVLYRPILFTSALLFVLPMVIYGSVMFSVSAISTRVVYLIAILIVLFGGVISRNRIQKIRSE